MKKFIIALAVVVIAAGGYAAITNKHGKTDNKNTAATINSSNTTKGKTACELVTLDDAKSLIGDNAKLSAGSGNSTNASSDSVKVDDCSYSADGATLGDLKQLTIQSHYGAGGLVKTAYQNFKDAYPGDDLSGLGDAAYYSTEGKQVHVLKGNYWIFVAAGSVNDSGNKDLMVQVAKLALNKL